MIKYKVEKYANTKSGDFVTFRETIPSKKLEEYKKNEWNVVEKIVPFITWWNKFSTTNKIAILAIFTPILFGGIYFLVEQYQNNKYESLNKDYYLLKNKFENSQSENSELKKLNKYLIDSLSKLNKKGESKPK
ncbi:hypothetical protein MC378_14405 [Polaribacter sp. MSW13]|uniref:Uncharacterized protein n=1 Tax=Polaribacter marinus TaxID=2916838 RepID=A0A9X2AL97_9FLAO|nr:hypothetical protein [Polaribacter marinus]MCI2230368.1 hypothetical protein [Polaribacter marinus]